MDHPASTEVDSLAAFERRFSRRGLLARYARGRLKHFANRQVMTAAGALVLFFVNGPAFGLAAVGFALLGEAIDCLYLRSVACRLGQGQPYRQIYVISTVTAMLQAMTIAVCVGLCWFGANSSESSLFPVAFLAGAAINGGLVLPFHPAAAIARLLVYFAMLLIMFGSIWVVDHRLASASVMDICGALIMTYLVYMFLGFVIRGFRENVSRTMELTTKGRELAEREKEARQLSLVARNANDAVILSDTKGLITWVNDAFTHITGYPMDEAIGHHPGDLLNGSETDPATVRDIARSVSLGVPYRGEIQNTRRDGSLIWIETNLVPVLDDKGTLEMMVAVERDVTDARRHAQEMADARRAAEEGARAKADFLATMSHEIRTPMNGVIGMADMLGGTGLSAEQTQYVDTIRNSAEALVKIINDILDMSKLDAKKMTLTLAPFDLRACLQEVASLLRTQAHKKGLTITLDGLDSLPGQVVGDEGRLRQVLINLIGNAVKFTDVGGVSVRARTMRASDDLRVVIEVEDTGVGIAQDQLNAIFDSFVQADTATTRRFGGTGLGLSISRRLIDAMAGKMEVRSTPGAGSCFSFAVTLGLSAEHQHDDPPEPDFDNLSGLQGRRILLAEDNRVNRMLIEKYLADTPVELRFAHDGQQAVDETCTWHPDLILMDMSMPVMSGLQATEYIRAQSGPQPVIVALTANAFDRDRAACLEAGMEGFLTKPVRRSDLLASLMHHCIPTQGANTG